LALSSENGSGAALLVNMRELALRLGVSRQTLPTWLDRWPDFPVEELGTNGREYRFDLTAVLQFLRLKKDEEAASTAARDQALAQLVLPFAPTEDDAPPPGLSLKDQLDAIKLRKATREESEAAGRLVEASEISDKLGTCFQQLHRAMHTAIRQAAHDHNLPDAVRRSLDTNLADAQRAFVRDAARFLTPSAPAAPDAE
jgi:hypothetical protein